MNGQLYESVGIECGTVQTDKGDAEVIGILYPTGVGEEVETVYMTLPAAKSLLIDLRDAIQACEHHKQ